MEPNKAYSEALDMSESPCDHSPVDKQRTLENAGKQAHFAYSLQKEISEKFPASAEEEETEEPLETKNTDKGR